MPWIAAFIVSAIVGLFAASASWSPEGWVVVIGAIGAAAVSIIGAIGVWAVRILKECKRIGDKAAESVPPEQLDELADRVAKKMRSSPHVTTLTLPKD